MGHGGALLIPIPPVGPPGYWVGRQAPGRREGNPPPPPSGPSAGPSKPRPMQGMQGTHLKKSDCLPKLAALARSVLPRSAFTWDNWRDKYALRVSSSTPSTRPNPPAARRTRAPSDEPSEPSSRVRFMRVEEEEVVGTREGSAATLTVPLAALGALCAPR